MKNKQLKKAWSKFITDCGLKYAITLNFNQEITSAGARAALKEFLNRLDRACLGPRFWKKDSIQRVSLFAVPENENTNYHFHCLASFPEVTGGILSTAIYIKNIWNKIIPAGSVEMKAIHEIEGWANYILKQKNDELDLCNIIISSEFHTK